VDLRSKVGMSNDMRYSRFGIFTRRGDDPPRYRFDVPYGLCKVL
jgi:hypothetical protein